MLLLWLFCFSPGSTGNGVQTSRKQSLLTSNNPTTLCIDSRFFLFSLLLRYFLYIYIWFNYVTFEHLLVICCSLLVVAKCASKDADDLFPSIFIYTILIFSIDTIWVYGSLRPIWLFITFLWPDLLPTKIQNILYKTLLEKLKTTAYFPKSFPLFRHTFWL